MHEYTHIVSECHSCCVMTEPSELKKLRFYLLELYIRWAWTQPSVSPGLKPQPNWQHVTKVTQPRKVWAMPGCAQGTHPTTLLPAKCSIAQLLPQDPTHMSFLFNSRQQIVKS
jgi:hypothetical protein